MITQRLNRRSLGLLVAAAMATTVLVGCSGSEDSSTSTTSTVAGVGKPASPWSFKDDRGKTIALDQVPDTIAADVATAAGLWEYGIDVNGGVFGEVKRADGSPGPTIGLADPDDFESIGNATELNLEKLALQNPDVIIASMWSETQYYGIGLEQLDEVESIAPVIGIRVDERSVTEPLARVAELAESLGADPDGEIADAKAKFDAASKAFTTASKAQPDLLVIAASGSPSEMYVAYPPAWPDLSYFQKLGMNLVEPKNHSTAGGFWETLSWEEANKYPADLVLADARGGSLEDLRAQMPPAALSLPPIEANQMVPWLATHAYGYGAFAQILGDLTDAVETADPTLGNA